MAARKLNRSKKDPSAAKSVRRVKTASDPYAGMSVIERRKADREAQMEGFKSHADKVRSQSKG